MAPSEMKPPLPASAERRKRDLKPLRQHIAPPSEYPLLTKAVGLAVKFSKELAALVTDTTLEQLVALLESRHS